MAPGWQLLVLLLGLLYLGRVIFLNGFLWLGPCRRCFVDVIGKSTEMVLEVANGLVLDVLQDVDLRPGDALVLHLIELGGHPLGGPVLHGVEQLVPGVHRLGVPGGEVLGAGGGEDLLGEVGFLKNRWISDGIYMATQLPLQCLFQIKRYFATCLNAD